MIMNRMYENQNLLYIVPLMRNTIVVLNMYYICIKYYIYIKYLIPTCCTMVLLATSLTDKIQPQLLAIFRQHIFFMCAAYFVNLCGSTYSGLLD